MLDFLTKFLRPAPPSGATAKERLRLVLLSDHLSLSPDVVDALKRELFLSISRYVEIDRDHADVSFEEREGEVEMHASIPITAVRRRAAEAAFEQPAPKTRPPFVPSAPAPPTPSAPVRVTIEPAHAAPAPEPARVHAPAPVPAAPATPEPARDAAPAEAPQLGADGTPVKLSPAAQRRRRRRRKALAAKRSAQQESGGGLDSSAQA